MRTAARLLVATTAMALALPPLQANDSEAEWALGGLVLRENADISMDSEELFISEGEIRVDYTYTNHAAEDREVTIAFPLPAQPDRARPDEYFAYPDWDGLGFSTTVDGAAAQWESSDRAIIEGRDVTEMVEAAGHPLRWYLDYEFQERINALAPTERAELVASGLFTDNREDPNYPRLEPAWQVQRHIIRTQTFPAGKRVRVSHRYVPLAGGSVGGALYAQVRNDPESGTLAHYRARYCVDDAFLAGIDRRLASKASGEMVMSETWVGYVLKSGANWRGPIGHFRLVVDKGSEDNLVSFCMDGVKKIGPTRFEVVKENFEPARDLDILIAKFFDTGE